MFRVRTTEFPQHAASTTVIGEEQGLIHAAVQGDMRAFQKLYEAHRNTVYSFLYYMVRDTHSAEDLLQSVFVKVFRGLAQYRFESAFRTWVCKIAFHEARNYQRRQPRHVSLEVIRGTRLEVDPKSGPEAAHQDQQRITIVRNVLLQLKPQLREVVILKYVQGLSYEEIASVIGRSSGTVASRLNRALEKMESLLARYRHSL